MIEQWLGRAVFSSLSAGVCKLLGVRQRTFHVDGKAISTLYRSGSGRKVALIHGFGADKTSWLSLLSQIDRQAALLVPDLPGFGESHDIAPNEVVSPAQAKLLAKLFDQIGWNNVHMVGNSMGGGISLRFAKDYPQRLQSLALLCSFGPLPEKSEVQHLLDKGVNPLIPKTLEEFRFLMNLISASPLPTLPFTDHYFASRQIARWRQNTQYFEQWINATGDESVPSSNEELAHIRVPTLVVHGAQDRVINRATSVALAHAIPNAKLEIWHDVGHVPQLEKPKRVGRILSRHWKHSEQSA